MAIQPTNLARACTYEWKPVRVLVADNKKCQAFLSPYTGNDLFYYDNGWKEYDGQTLLVYERANWREYNGEIDGMAVQYSNDVIRVVPETETETPTETETETETETPTEIPTETETP